METSARNQSSIVQDSSDALALGVSEDLPPPAASRLGDRNGYRVAREGTPVAPRVARDDARGVGDDGLFERDKKRKKGYCLRFHMISMQSWLVDSGWLSRYWDTGCGLNRVFQLL